MDTVALFVQSRPTCVLPHAPCLFRFKDHCCHGVFQGIDCPLAGVVKETRGDNAGPESFSSLKKKP
jgi:hypothetical protein